MVLLWKDHKQKMRGGTETQRCEMHSPRQPQAKYQGREQQHSCPLASDCPCPHWAPPSASMSSLPEALQKMAHSCFIASLPVAWNQAHCARRHISLFSERVLQVHWYPCRSLFLMHFWNYFFYCFFTIEPTVIATGRTVGYHPRAETRWLHSKTRQVT